MTATTLTETLKFKSTRNVEQVVEMNYSFEEVNSKLEKHNHKPLLNMELFRNKTYLSKSSFEMKMILINLMSELDFIEECIMYKRDCEENTKEIIEELTSELRLVREMITNLKDVLNGDLYVRIERG